MVLLMFFDDFYAYFQAQAYSPLVTKFEGWCHLHCFTVYAIKCMLT